MMPLGKLLALVIGNDYFSTHLNGGNLGLISVSFALTFLCIKHVWAFFMPIHKNIRQQRTKTLKNIQTFATGGGSGPPSPNYRKKVTEIMNSPSNPVLNGSYNITNSRAAYLV